MLTKVNPPIIRLYRVALACFPPAYRREYGDELLYAIRMAALEARAQGRFALWRLAWRELRDLPLAILRAHLNERRPLMKLQFGSHLPGGPVRLWQLLIFFLPFLLPLLSHINGVLYVPNPTSPGGLDPFCNLELLFFGFLFVAWKSWRVGRLQVWALPALGTLLFLAGAILQLFVQQAAYFYIAYPIYGGWPDAFAQKIWMGLLQQFIFLAVMVAIVVGLFRNFPGFQRWVRQDWSMLSFLLYGVAILPAAFGVDEYHGLAPYEIASLLILVSGAMLFLLPPRRWQRVLPLVVASILSPAAMSLGLYQLFPVQSWVLSGEVTLQAQAWASLRPLLYLLPLPIMLLLAALAPRLPWDAERESAAFPPRHYELKPLGRDKDDSII
jgi:hypothetical protein